MIDNGINFNPIRHVEDWHIERVSPLGDDRIALIVNGNGYGQFGVSRRKSVWILYDFTDQFDGIAKEFTRETIEAELLAATEKYRHTKDGIAQIKGLESAIEWLS